MGGRGSSSGGAAASGSGAAKEAAVDEKQQTLETRPEGYVDGVEYQVIKEKGLDYDREYHMPLVSQKGIDSMNADLAASGISPIGQSASELNAMDHGERNAFVLRPKTREYLKSKTGAEPRSKEIESQLNKWGLSNKKIYIDKMGE